MNSNSKVQQAKAAGHTPIPMYEAKTGNHQGLICREGTGENIAVVYDKAHTPFIVRACNAHDALVGVIRGLLSCTELNMDDMEEHTRQEIRHAQAALKLAKGELPQ